MRQEPVVPVPPGRPHVESPGEPASAGEVGAARIAAGPATIARESPAARHAEPPDEIAPTLGEPRWRRGFEAHNAAQTDDDDMDLEELIERLRVRDERQRRHRRLVVGAIVLGLLVVVLAGGIWLRRGQGARPVDDARPTGSLAPSGPAGGPTSGQDLAAPPTAAATPGETDRVDTQQSEPPSAAGAADEPPATTSSSPSARATTPAPAPASPPASSPAPSPPARRAAASEPPPSPAKPAIEPRREQAEPPAPRPPAAERSGAPRPAAPTPRATARATPPPAASTQAEEDRRVDRAPRLSLPERADGRQPVSRERPVLAPPPLAATPGSRMQRSTPALPPPWSEENGSALATGAADARGAATSELDVAVATERISAEAVTFTVRVRSLDGAPVTDATVAVRGRRPEGTLVEAPLEQIEPGVYRSTLRAAPDGPRDLRVRVARSDQVAEVPVPRPR